MLRKPSAYRTSRLLTACFGVAALILSLDTASARSGGGVGARGAAPHVAARGPGARGFRHHGGFVPGGYWPGAYAYGPTDSAPAAEAPTGPVSADIRTTYTYDVPWDWAHRYPPNVVPSDRPYVSSCPTETVQVPGRGGDHTINITRCY